MTAESVFETVATKESRMVEFENRIQHIEESADEFMQSLIKLYRAADPDATDVVSTKAIKRRFLGGISTDVRQSIYIFCNDPHSTTVSYQNLLEHARKAKMLVLERRNDKQSLNAFSTNINLEKPIEPTPSNDHILKVISDFNERVNKSMYQIESNYSNPEGINVISRSRNNYRGNRNRYNYNRGTFSNRNGTSSNWRDNKNMNNEQSGDVLRCFKCNGVNHYARDCRSKNF